MKVTDRHPDFWATEADEGHGWLEFAKAGLVFTFLLVAGYGWLLVAAATRD